MIKAKQQAETEAILAALNSTRWNRKQAAALLKIDYKALLYKMKKLGVEERRGFRSRCPHRSPSFERRRGLSSGIFDHILARAKGCQLIGRM